ncbi:hypothetical protein N7519_007471 [Penicillium mononematosum]|uniref:uncharacterized protein n=1 Tax=Penicillium mononematosum TaxID=268346 RepID=UPI002546C1AC|nr:uncharacterized protein N7519_007471 [Penicillium mononematosum]KAJ6186170.1 hypothetical protein N7519_007471 [Penicillium mononematosum]
MVSTTVLEDVGSSQEPWKIVHKASFMADQKGIAFAAVTISSANQLVTPEHLEASEMNNVLDSPEAAISAEFGVLSEV